MSAERSQASDAMQPMGELVSESVLRKICKLGFPKGGIATCHVCHKTREYDFDQVVKLLRKSFPKHCERTIDLKP